MSITIGNEGSAIFDANMAWDNYCLENNILDPFEALRKLSDEHTTYKGNFDGSMSIIIDDMTEEQKQREKELKIYRDKYILDRYKWVGQYLLEHNGYNTLSYFAQLHTHNSALLEWFASILPCDGKENQCSIFCPKFNECKGDK